MELIPKEHILAISDRSLWRFLGDSLGVLRRMRALRFDTAIDCELFARISSIFSFFSGAAIRVGFHAHNMEGLYRGDFINRPVLYNPYQRIPDQFLGLVEAIDSNSRPRNKFAHPRGQWRATPVRFGEDELAAMKNRLAQDYPQIAGQRLVLLYPGGGLLPLRAWPMNYFCQLAQGLILQGYAVAVIGMPEDGKLAQLLINYCGSSSGISLTGYTKSIRELLLLFHLAELLVTNDGGPGQFAVLTPIKSILFYGPETPALYGPLDDNSHLFYRPISCSPCLTAYNHRNSPCDGDNLCLKSIHPQEVLEKALALLSPA